MSEEKPIIDVRAIEDHLTAFNEAVAAIVSGNRSADVLRDAEFNGKNLISAWRTGREKPPAKDDVAYKNVLAQVKTALEHSLELREVTQDASDSVKETLIKEERVHPMESTQELTDNRLAPAHYDLGNGSKNADGKYYSKHAYGIFLPWETEPSCVVYTAHINDVKRNPILSGDKDLPNDIAACRFQSGQVMDASPRYVMFYSISNITQELPGFRLGPILLGKLEGELGKQLTNLSRSPITYSTLSPARLFPKWLNEKLGEVAADPSVRMFTQKEIQDVAAAFDGMTPAQMLRHYMPIEKVSRIVGGEAVSAYEVTGAAPAFENDKQREVFHQLRDDLCLEFLATSRQDRKWMKNSAYDGVADFHLGNGAYIGNIAMQPLHSDIQQGSPEWHQAGGVMANYVYSPLVKEFEQSYKGHGNAENSKIILSDHLFQRLCIRHMELGQSTLNRDAATGQAKPNLGEIENLGVMSLQAAKQALQPVAQAARG